MHRAAADVVVDSLAMARAFATLVKNGAEIKAPPHLQIGAGGILSLVKAKPPANSTEGVYQRFLILIDLYS